MDPFIATGAGAPLRWRRFLRGWHHHVPGAVAKTCENHKKYIKVLQGILQGNRCAKGSFGAYLVSGPQLIRAKETEYKSMNGMGPEPVL